MTEYYEITDVSIERPLTNARLITPRTPYMYERFSEPFPIIDPPTIEIEWSGEPSPPDWCPARVPHRLFSRRMAEVVRANLGPLDAVEWVPAIIRSLGGEVHSFEIPHFLTFPDVYDNDATAWGPSGLPIRWVLARPKIEGRHFFSPPALSKQLVVSSEMHSALCEAELKGIVVRPARVSHGPQEGCGR